MRRAPGNRREVGQANDVELPLVTRPPTTAGSAMVVGDYSVCGLGRSVRVTEGPRTDYRAGDIGRFRVICGSTFGSGSIAANDAICGSATTRGTSSLETRDPGKAAGDPGLQIGGIAAAPPAALLTTTQTGRVRRRDHWRGSGQAHALVRRPRWHPARRAFDRSWLCAISPCSPTDTAARRSRGQWPTAP